MKSTFLLPLFGSILLLTACAVIDKTHIDRPSSWSSEDPLSIPYGKRMSQLEKGNLVKNPSFEDGRRLTDDPANTFMLTGWQAIGQNISWIDREAVSGTSDTVYDGRHCIKIARKTASEVDAAEGIISEYIPVIPGNYDFTFHIRLQNILNNRYRLGVQLYDAIVVKVLFFDERKQPVDTGYLNPVSGAPIDNSDKSYAFSNYWRIDDFPWGRVRGRSYNYPFSEGDIPDQARYVRLFFGLKGTGTLWLDNINFGYSKWNFTALERFEPFFDKHLTLAERLIPTPKHIEKIDDIPYYDIRSSQSRLPLIVLPEKPAAAERSAAKILQKKITEIYEKTISDRNHNGSTVSILENDFSFNDILNRKLIISIGNNNVYQNVHPKLALQSIDGQNQAYIIKAEKIGDCHVVFLVGETPIGSYNAATTALQLFEDQKFIYHNATIVDYPDFLGRSYVFKNWNDQKELQNDLDAIERMSLFKLNKVYFGYNRNKKNWYQPDDLYRKGLGEVGRIIKENGVMSLAVMVNPYSHFDMESSVDSLDDELRHIWTHGSSESFKMLKDVYQIGLEAGAETIMLLSDDFVPHVGNNRQNYSLYTPDDKKRFVNLQNAQAHTINDLKNWIDSDYPGTRIEFCPPWYSNEHIDRSDGKAEVYFKELTFQIPQDVAIVWTGPTIRSLSIDMADFHRYRSLIGRWPMLWDNTLYARNIETKRYGGYTTHYPGKIRMCNLFEPYDTDMPENFQRFNDRRQIYTNGNAYSDVYKIKYATVADYQWNTTAYNPERSLWKILCRTYGPDCAQKLIRFSDAYYQLYGICFRMEREGATDHNAKEGDKALSTLNHYLIDISQTLSEPAPLLEELVKMRDKQQTRFEKLSQQRTGLKVEGKSW